MNKSKMIVRTKFVDRACHWTVVICFFLVAVSGISFFFPTLQWLTETMSMIFVLLVTGVIIWRPYFAQYFPIQVVRYALLIHATSAIILIHAILIHMYMAFWVKGSIKGMIEGKVSRRWAQKHHPRWYRDVERLEAQKESSEGLK